MITILPLYIHNDYSAYYNEGYKIKKKVVYVSFPFRISIPFLHTDWNIYLVTGTEGEREFLQWDLTEVLIFVSLQGFPLASFEKKPSMTQQLSGLAYTVAIGGERLLN